MGKIIITGSGRAGSTFLVQLMTRLGFDTGMEAYQEHYRDDLRAGCEWFIRDLPPDITDDELREFYANGPRVQKAPGWAFALKGALDRGIVEVDHIIMPFRDLDIAAQSRLDVGLDWLIPDDIQNDDDRVTAQANIHSMAVGRTIEAALLYEIPLTVMRFPLFVQDVDYCYDKLREVGGIDYDLFRPVFGQLANPEMIKWG